MILMTQPGINWLMTAPTPTARAFKTRMAAAEPRMMSRSLNREVMATIRSWVLSPSSAMNMVSRTWKKSSIMCPPCRK